MKIKRILAVSLFASAMLLSACNGGSGSGGSSGPIDIDTNVPKEALGEYNITVWGSEVDGVEELFRKQIKDFCDLNPGLTLNVTYEEVSEKDASAKVLADVDAAADIYCFAQDQFSDLVQGQALNRLGETAAKAIKANNSEQSVKAVTSGEALYAYPMTADNGYFMYYDTRVVKENHVGSLEDIVADCEAAGKNFAMETDSSAWYVASFFFGAGCNSTWETDDDGNFVDYDDDWNSEKGLIAMRGMQHLNKSEYYVSSSSVSQFTEANPAAVVVSGIWDYEAAKKALGENLGIAELPSFHVDGKAYHMGSFSGFKLMGVKPSSDVKRTRVLSTLALYLTGEKCQIERFDAVAWGPSNKVAAALDKVQANPALAALLKQSTYSRPQGPIPGAWWDFAKVLGSVAEEAAQDDTKALQAGLTSYYESMEGIVSVTEKPVYGLVGSFAGKDGSWTAGGAYLMTKNAQGVWEVTVTLAAGDQFKVCKVLKDAGQVYDWKFGFSGVSASSGAYASFEDAGGNIGVKTAGSYKVTTNGFAVVIENA